ncbi:MAG TPA: hypothetical protein VLT86_06860 [Vicinamibacterales bacterium]|nr:hypothetical protein [Vicinamibacterales bacterium]
MALAAFVVTLVAQGLVLLIGFRLSLKKPPKRTHEYWFRVVCVLAGVGIAGSIADRMLTTPSPAKLQLAVRPVVTTHHVEMPATSEMKSFTEYGIAMIVHATNSGDLPGYVKALHVDGELPLNGNEFVSMVPDGLTLDEIDKKYGEVLPYRVLAWDVSPLNDEGRIDRGANRFILFQVLKPASSPPMREIMGNPADYSGSRTGHAPPKTKTEAPYLFDLIWFAGQSPRGELLAPRLRDEVRRGLVRISVETANSVIELPIDAVEVPTLHDERDLNDQPLRNIFDDIDIFGGRAPRTSK